MPVFNERDMREYQAETEKMLYGQTMDLERKKAMLQVQLAAVRADLRNTISTLKSSQASLDSARASLRSVSGEASDSAKACNTRSRLIAGRSRKQKGTSGCFAQTDC